MVRQGRGSVVIWGWFGMWHFDHLPSRLTKLRQFFWSQLLRMCALSRLRKVGQYICGMHRAGLKSRPYTSSGGYVVDALQ